MTVYRLGRGRFQEFKDYLTRLGFKFEERAHQVFLARYPGLTVNLYESGKVTIGGSDELLRREIEWYLTKLDAEAVEEVGAIGFEGRARIGTDESGKGDFFGPLVVAGVLVEPSCEEGLRSTGVRDSKRIRSDKKISELARDIRRIVGGERIEVVVINPLRYNELLDKLDNLNELLGWAHSRAIENLLKRNEGCDLAVADQFGSPRYIKSELMERGRSIELIQIPRGEQDIAVAAASIMARDRFIRSIERLSVDHGMAFPRGATRVREAVFSFVEMHGAGRLREVAKLNFSIAEEIVSGGYLKR